MIVSISRSVMALARVWLVVVCVSVLASLAAPFGLNKDHEKAMEELKQQLRKLKDLPGVDQEEYLRYWKEAVKDDPMFGRLRDMAKLRHGDDKIDLERLVEENPYLSERLAKDSVNVRSRLEEAKRANIEEMRQLQRLQTLRDDKALKDGDWMNKLEGMREKLPPDFSHEDIAKRIQEQRKLLSEIDTERRAEFKRAELLAEHRRREMLRGMEEKKRLAAEQEFQQKQEKLRAHGKLHHPASEQQLEDVWEKEDGMDRDKFDPKTFFHLHDKNSDKHLDALEWENLFYNELHKVYGEDMGGLEAREDLARMREHVIKEMDKDNDGMVSMEEFIGYTKSSEFGDDEPWDSVVDDAPFQPDELDKFEEDYDDYYDYEYDDNGNLIGFKTKPDKGQNSEEQPGKIPSHVNEQEQPPQQVNEQGHPPQQVNEQGHPPQQVNKQGQPPVPSEGIPGRDTPQVEDPQAVHFKSEGDVPQEQANL